MNFDGQAFDKKKLNYMPKCFYLINLIRQIDVKAWARLSEEFKNLKVEDSFDFYGKLVECYRNLKGGGHSNNVKPMAKKVMATPAKAVEKKVVKKAAKKKVAKKVVKKAAKKVVKKVVKKAPAKKTAKKVVKKKDVTKKKSK